MVLSEVIRGVRIASGLQPISDCAAFDDNSDRLVTVEELVKGVRRALNGCPPVGSSASCTLAFVPEIISPDERATLRWSAKGVESCVLSCEEGPAAATVLTEGSQTVRAHGPIGCTLRCQDAGERKVTECRAQLPVVTANCAPPSCAAQVNGSPQRGYVLRAATDAKTCTYYCPGFGTGTLDCGGELPLGPELRDCRVWASSSCRAVRRCSTRAWTTPITVDGGLRDWPPGTQFPTNGGQNYISWDAENIYIALQHQSLATRAATTAVMVYLGNGESGLSEADILGTQSCLLPVRMSHAVRWSPGSRAAELLVASPNGRWVESPASREVSVAGDLATASVEIAVPRHLLAVDQKLYVHVDIVDTRAGQERSFAATPASSHLDGYLGPGSVCKAVQQFDIFDFLQPNSAALFKWDFGNLPQVEPTLPDTAYSLRIVTFNGQYLDIPGGESDLEDHIGAVCAEVSAASPLLALGVVTGALALGMPQLALLGVVLPPPGPAWFPLCEAAVHAAIGYLNDQFEVEGGGTLTHEKRAQEVAARVLNMDLDVIAFNEVFIEDARDKLVDMLSPKFPYVVARLEPPADTDASPSEIVEPHFGAYFVQDAGTMLFSRYPFLPLSDQTFLAPDDQVDLWWEGAKVDNSAKNAVAFKQYGRPCHREDCNAGKGVGLVHIEKTPEQRFTVAFTHTQASYGKDDPDERNQTKDIRRDELEAVHTLIAYNVTPSQQKSEEVFAMGDLNITGLHPDGESLNENDWPDWDPTHQQLTGLEKLSAAENSDWDLARQEWLYHFCGVRTGDPDDPCRNADPQESHLQDPIVPTFFGCGNGTVGECPDVAGRQLLVDSWAYDTSPHDLGRSQGSGAFNPATVPCTKEGEAYFADPNLIPPPFAGYERLRTTFCSGERLDYILHNKPGASEHNPTDRNSLCAQHMTIAWELSGAAGTQPLSDHVPVRGDFNRWYHHCRPPEAKVIGKSELPDPDHTFVASTASNSDYQIKFPGSMQWFRIDEPGSYSIGVSSGFTYDVYDDEDLSRPRPSYHKMVTEWGVRYHLPKPPYYVRVYAVTSGGIPDREKIGAYSLTVHRHDCTSALDACEIVAGSHTAALWPDEHFTAWDPSDVHYEAGPDALWFIFSTYADDKGILPTLSFDHEAQYTDNYDLEIVEFCEMTSGPCFPSHAIVVDDASFDTGPSEEDCELCTFSSKQLHAEAKNVDAPPFTVAAQGRTYFLRVLRKELLGPGGIPCFMTSPCGALEPERMADVRFGTNLTFFYPSTLRLELSEDDIGDDTDELWYFPDVDAPSPTMTQTADYVWLDYAVEGGPSVGVGDHFGDFGVRSYIVNLQPNLYSSEEMGASIDDTDPEWFVPQEGSYLNAADPGNAGLSPLAENFAGSQQQLKGLAAITYSDVPTPVDPEEADYVAHLQFCLVHEYVESIPPYTAVDACASAGKE